MVGQVQDRADDTSRTNRAAAKKRYRRPVLSTLGTLRDLTMATNGSGSTDGSNHMHTPLRTGRGGRNGRGRRAA